MYLASSVKLSAKRRLQRGFLLSEMLVALAVLGVFIVVMMQWQQQQQRQRQLQHGLEYAQRLVSVLQDHYMHYNAYPSSMATLIDTGLWQQDSVPPVGSEWQWRTVDGYLELTLLAATTAQAQWLSSQWLGSVATGQQVRYRQLIPVQLGPSEPSQWLHRQAVVGRPELNQMQTTLDLGGHDLANVGRVDAAEISAIALTADELKTTALLVEQLRLGASDWQYADGVVSISGAEFSVLGDLQVQQELRANLVRATELRAEQASIDALNATQLQVSQLQASALSAERLVLTELETDVLTAQAITATELAAEVMAAQRLTASQLQVGRIDAGRIYAEEIFAGDVSLRAADQQLTDLAGLWQACINAGGCQ